nr:L-type lectin-domain containing receptor kinase IX.1-like [Ipomoea batatas]
MAAAIAAFLFLLQFPSLVCSLSFDLPSFGPKDTNAKIIVEGDAYITDQGIQLTPNERQLDRKDKSGRAKYVDSLHLWDKASGDLADFTTHFTFNIDSDGSFEYADGLAFFLANFSAPFNKTLTHGGGLGLMNWTEPTSTDPFVAVVFDTYSNQDNQPRTNVSINIKSMLSPANITTWFNDIPRGKDNNASITYDATSKILQVVFTGFWNNQSMTDSLSSEIDLTKYLPEFVSVGFSAATGWLFEKNTISSWRFNSTSLSSPVVALLALPIIYTCLKKMGAEKRNNHDIIILGQAMDSEFQMVSSGPKKFSYTELETATNNFAEEHKLGEGGFGGVYRGFLNSLNLDVAVKRVSSGSKQGIKEYAAEVKIISRLRHRNLVPLHGWCHDKGELLLVYEYMLEGSLDSHLFKRKSPLNWDLRYKIAQGLASALSYLHEEWEQCVLHRDIKSSNVLLDSDFNARLGDFGLAWLVDHGNVAEKTISGGTPGYLRAIGAPATTVVPHV